MNIITVDENNITRNITKQHWSTILAAKIHSFFLSLSNSFAFVCLIKLLTPFKRHDWESISWEIRSSPEWIVEFVLIRLSLSSAHRSSNSFFRILDIESRFLSGVKECFRCFFTWPFDTCRVERPDGRLLSESCDKWSTLCCRNKSLSREIWGTSHISYRLGEEGGGWGGGSWYKKAYWVMNFYQRQMRIHLNSLNEVLV